MGKQNMGGFRLKPPFVRLPLVMFRFPRVAEPSAEPRWHTAGGRLQTQRPPPRSTKASDVVSAFQPGQVAMLVKTGRPSGWFPGGLPIKISNGSIFSTFSALTRHHAVGEGSKNCFSRHVMLFELVEVFKWFAQDILQFTWYGMLRSNDSQISLLDFTLCF